MTKMTRGQFLKPSMKTREVALPDSGMVLIRKLTCNDVMDARELGKTKGDGAAARRLVSIAVVDEAGNRVFDDGDADALGEADFDTVNAVVGAIVDFNGMGTGESTPGGIAPLKTTPS